MQPFDLNKALSGAPLVTRDGRKVTGFRKMKRRSGNFKYEAQVSENYARREYTDAGFWLEPTMPSGEDLFLADDPNTPQWLPIDWDNLPEGEVAAMGADKIVYSGWLMNSFGEKSIMSNCEPVYNTTHYIPLKDLVNLPIGQ